MARAILTAILVMLLMFGSWYFCKYAQAREILDLSYYQIAVLDATKINPDYKIACQQVYKQAFYDGKVEKARGPDGRMAAVQMEISLIYNNCMAYWQARQRR